MLRYSCKSLSSETYFPQRQKEANGSVLSLVIVTEKMYHIIEIQLAIVTWILFLTL